MFDHNTLVVLLGLGLTVAPACATTRPAAPRTAAEPVASAVTRSSAATAVGPSTPARPRPHLSHPGPQPGEPAPSLAEVRWFRGRAPSAGEPYLLFFWGTWCKPCKAVVPQTLAYAEARGLPLIGLSRDTPEAIEAFLASWPAAFVQRLAYEHPRYPVHLAYDAFSVPRLVEVGADGRVVAVHYGVVGIRALAP